MSVSPAPCSSVPVFYSVRKAIMEKRAEAFRARPAITPSPLPAGLSTKDTLGPDKSGYRCLDLSFAMRLWFLLKPRD